MAKENDSNPGSTPYDDVFRTLVVEHSQLVIKLINEMFPEVNYTGKETTIQLNETYFINHDTSDQEKRILDSVMAVISIDGNQKIFHLECQSTLDGSMLIRIFEYDTQIALKTSNILEDNTLEVTMPTTGILYLRSNCSTPDYMTIKVNSPYGDTMTYDIPTLKLSEYDCNTILEKELYFLIPFYLFNFEDYFAKIEAGDMTVIDAFRTKYSEIYDKLKELLIDGKIDAFTHHSIIMLTKKIIAALAQNKATVKEEADKIMGGQVLDYETKAILKQGIEQGIEQGIQIFIQDKIEDGYPEDIILEKLQKRYNLTLEKAMEDYEEVVKRTSGKTQ